MNAAIRPGDALLPRPPGGQAAGTMLALAVHGVLAASLAGAVQWRTEATAPVVAELWSALPEPAAPSAPPAPPAAPPAAPPVAAPRAQAPQAEAPTPPAAIALERARQRARAEQERQERTATERRRREQRERQAHEEETQLERTRQENLRRMMSQAGTAGTTGGRAGQETAPSASYVARIAAEIRRNATFPAELPGNPVAEVEVRTGPSGAIIARRLVKPSGHAAWDEAVLRAIDKTARLPRDESGHVPAVLLIAFRRNE